MTLPPRPSAPPPPARSRLRRGVPWLLLALPFAVLGCDRLLTTAPEPSDLFDAPFDGLSPQETAAFAEGDAQFAKPFAIGEGLGPLFNNVSCASCHSGDGRGLPENVLSRFSVAGDPALELGGPQLQDRAIPGAEPERLPAGVELSRRLPPPVFGAGLIEAIPADSILARADASDADGDGISGRPNLVFAPDFVPAHEPGGGAGPRLGRFGRKAQVSTLLQQVVDAYHQDIGITTDFRADENVNPLAARATEASDRVADPELPASAVRAVVGYLRLLAPPRPGPMTAARARGRVVFESVGCASCHTPSFRTGPNASRALSDRE